ncbi:flagellar transcriptional regulator FlhD [Glaciimonas soli]|uniref:Flagellar transcriptional regulator FlhD n=1 Tax=Glaciimonas soli TaxID=2590999 RepID=A0A843YJD2_9BURK|nr:flagellar transcriptional regulator FlhD [Glaciimonas soli]MQQ99484.1 flagellar transcriptional regulator FlhD [Glaciimonas soli]
MDGLSSEISEVNLSYLLLTQRMLREDRASAMYRMGISKELADLLEKLSLSQVVKLSASSSLLCRFRFDDHTILSALTHAEKDNGLQQAHASILLAGQQVERGV